MMAAMPAHIFSEWMAYERIEPFGTPMDELRTGILAATVVNAQPSAGRGRRKPVTPAAFMPVAAAKQKGLAQLRPASNVSDQLRDVFATLSARRAKRKGKDVP